MGFSKINKRIFSIFLIANTCYISVYAFDLEIKLQPEIPTISTDISITVFVRGELAANVKWYWIINREPNDFGNYPNDPSKVELKTLSTKNYSNSKIQFRRTKVGVYKVYLYVIDEKNNQNSLTYYVPVIESDGLLSSIRIEDYDIDSITEFQLGSQVVFYDRIRLQNIPNEYSKYDGVFKVQWYIGHQNNDYYFNTTSEMQSGNYKKYYLEGDHPICVYMINSGEYSIQLNAWGGKFGYLVGQRRNPLSNVTDYYNTQTVKNFKVIDCSKILHLDNINNYKQGVPYKEIYLSLAIDDGKEYNFRAYSQIKLEDGFSVKQGALFSAKIVPEPPLIKCNCTGIPTIVSPKSVNAMADNIHECTVDLIFNTKTMNVQMDNPVKYLQIWTLEGKMLKMFTSNLTDIDISFLSAGFYILKAFDGYGFSSKKILIK